MVQALVHVHACCCVWASALCGRYSKGGALQVKDWIARMKDEGKAFYSGNFYLLAGVLLQKVSERQPAAADMTDGLLALMTALK